MSWAAGIPIIGELLGGYFNNQANMAAVDKSADRAQANAREQMAFQEKMSNSALQRAREDAKKAGLNPLLATTNPASTPTGAMGGVETAKLSNIAQGLGSTAMTMKQLDLAEKKQSEELNLIRAQTGKTAMETKVMSKGIPEADLKNSVYNMVKQVFQSSAKNKPTDFKPNPKFNDKQKKLHDQLKVNKQDLPKLIPQSKGWLP